MQLSESCLLLLLLLYNLNRFALCSDAYNDDDDDPYVDLSIGRIYGISTFQSHEYLGIPFAKINQRWTPPQHLYDITFENNEFEATSFGPCCNQLPTEYSSLTIPLPTSETDCLSLNIFTPTTTTHKRKNENNKLNLLPVMVWIYGGGSKFGCSSQSIPVIYNGSNLIGNAPNDQKVIVVTLNYRLDIFSSLYLPELSQEDPQFWSTSGNYGSLDIVSALKWIQIHITKFGGDPKSVTLFGESAGANYGINLGAMSPITNGLFHAVISESGTPFVSAGYSNITEASYFSYSIASSVGCDNDNNNQAFLQCLRNVDSNTLMIANMESGWNSVAVVDGVVLLNYPQQLMRDKKYMNVALFMGHNDPDNWPGLCLYFPDADTTLAVEYVSNLLVSWGVPEGKLQDVFDLYQLNECTTVNNNNDDPENSEKWCCTLVKQIMLDYTMMCPSRRALNEMYYSMKQRDLYLYEFECTPSCPVVSLPVCQHTSEIQYVFATVSDYVSNDDDLQCDWNDDEREFSNNVVDVWTSFAYDGDIEIASRWIPNDSRKNEDGLSQFFFIDPTQNGFLTKTFSKDQECDFWDQIEQELNDEKFGHIADAKGNDGDKDESGYSGHQILSFFSGVDAKDEMNDNKDEFWWRTYVIYALIAVLMNAFFFTIFYCLCLRPKHHKNINNKIQT